MTGLPTIIAGSRLVNNMELLEEAIEKSGFEIFTREVTEKEMRP